jgi:molecular chaperone GrpE
MKEGFALIHSLLKTTVEKNGLTPIDAIGQPFNTDLHEAIAHLPVDEKAKKGCVIEQVEKGYYLNDKVIRFAKVVVGQ